MSNGIRNTAAAFALSESAAAESGREFAFSDADFRDLAQYAYDQAGIALADNKRNLVYSRLSRRLRALNQTTFREYREYLASTPSELEAFINAISTNLTKFFRESHHFDHFRTHVAVPFGQSRQPGARRLRVWSAGCSTGEEPHTIALVLKREIRDIRNHDVRILATDIDTEVIAKGKRGEYAATSIDEVPKAYREYFRAGPSASKTASVVVSDDVRSLITFRRLNLMEQWPFSGLFDAVFCRNVMIYFDGPTKTALVNRLRNKLSPAVGFTSAIQILDRVASRPGASRPHRLPEEG